MLLSASCSTRNNAFSTRDGMRVACAGITRLILRPLRLQKPSMYEQRAGTNSWPSSNGGGRSKEKEGASSPHTHPHAGCTANQHCNPPPADLVVMFSLG